MTIRVVVSGAGGNLANPIIRAVDSVDDLTVGCLFNPNRAGMEIEGHVVVGSFEEVDGDVVVETAHPDHVFDNLAAWKATGMAAVVGTSGFTEDRIRQLGELWGTDGPACLVVPNFSVGAVLMMEFARTAARYFEAVEIIERHHSTKPDAPSGTALATAAAISAGGGSSSDQSSEMVPGVRGGDVGGVRVHSLRLPGLISQQEVVLSNPGELLSVEHMSTSYDSFASGALLAIRRVGELGPGVHLGLASLLE
ncbi:MAG TPA: 4-hydroxy-tetrahydrodipicolinate reductase [Acidimicrobiia bacterium]